MMGKKARSNKAIHELRAKKIKLQRKHVAEAMIANETKFHAILTVVPVPMAVNDEHGNITYLNPAFVQKFGYTQEDIPTLAHWWPAAYPDPEYRQWVADTWQAELEQAKLSGEAFSPVELTVMCKNESTKTVLVGTAMISNSHEGEHLVVLYDITERKQAEAAVRTSHEHLESILDSLDSLVYVADFHSYEILFLNKYGRERWGDVQGKTCWQVLQKGQLGPCAFCSNARLVSDTGTSTGVYQWEFQNMVDGKWYECRDQAILLTNRELVRMEIATDISERKQTEQTLQELKVKIGSQELYSVLVEMASDGFWLLDKKFLTVYVNPALEGMLGYKKEEMLGRSWYDFGDPGWIARAQ